MRPSTVALLFVALLGLFHVATATSVSLEAVDPSCPPMAKYRVGLCKRLLPTMQQEGGIKLHFGQGEVICGIARFAYEDMRECSKVYDHVAEVGKAWDLVERLRGSTAEIFCIHALAEPVYGRAIISPRTERKCLGTKTSEDDKFDMESEVPEGYTGNILEDPFNTDISYINNCRCACKNQFNPDNQGCKCNCNKKPPSTPSVKVPSTPPKSSLPTPLKPLPPPAVCKKGSYIYEFPYTQYLTNKGDVHVVASFELQRMRVYRGEKMLKEYKMSSSEVGIGSADGSLRSPSGRFTIAQLVGSGAKSGADFVNLKTNGKFSKKTDKAATQSRILVLDGDDTDNKNSKSRLIYIHGTNKVDALGHPASQGSFRLANKDVIDLFKRVKVGTKFFAIPKCAWPKPGTKATKKPKAKKPKAKKPKAKKPKAKKPKAKKPKSKKPKAKKPKTKKPKKAKKPKSKKPKSKKPKSKKKDKKNKKPKKGSKKPKKGSKKPKKGSKKLKNGKKGPKSPKQPKNAGKCPTVPGFPYSPATNVVVDYELQRLRLYQGANLVKEYVISSGVGGVGSKFSSSQSPAGAFVIHSKVGEGYPVGTDFVALKPTTKKSGPNDKAALQTRVITLQGLEAGNKNTLARMIYIHGTNKPQELGRPTSAGCIRLSNSDIIDLFGRIQVGTTFTAKARCAWAR